MSESVNPSGPPVPRPPAASSARTPRRPKAQATRRRIRDAARRLFVERGYVATTIEAIAGEAGVAVPTVYLAFGTKRALLVELLDIAAVGAADPDIAAQVHHYKILTLHAHRYFVTVLAANGGLRDGLGPERAADIVFGLLSHELYRLLVIEQGWAPEDWERWAADTLAAQLLPAH